MPPIPIAYQLAEWAASLVPMPTDLELADRSLLDVLAVTVAASGDPLRSLARTCELPDAARWATLGHVLDFDDLHMESSAHVSVVCVPAVLAIGGGAQAYLAAAGVMARLGAALGWSHYRRGWHATCTAGAPAAAVGAGVALGLDPDGIARAMALAVPAAGGVQRAFGTAAKPLQVGFAADAGVRAARLAAAGASADPAALDQWFELLGGDQDALGKSLGEAEGEAGPAVPGGLAIKLFPCCYASQRPIHAVRQLLDPGDAAADLEEVERIVVQTPACALQPLLRARPRSGLEGKFSLQYAIAATLADGWPGFDSFTDQAVNRPAVQALLDRIEVRTSPDGEGLLWGRFEVELRLRDGSARQASVDLPPGAPAKPPTPPELWGKLLACTGDEAAACWLQAQTWETAARSLRRPWPSRTRRMHE
jgi:2-methylcitrate dehydratase PrpD